MYRTVTIGKKPEAVEHHITVEELWTGIGLLVAVGLCEAAALGTYDVLGVAGVVAVLLFAANSE